MTVRPALMLDTTVQIERLFYPLDDQAAVESIIADYEVFTSSTTFREFQGSILAAFEYVIAVLRDLNPGGPSTDVSIRLDEIIRRIAVAPSFSSRQASRVQLVVALLAAAFPTSESTSIADVLDLLDGEVRRHREWRFFEIGYHPDQYDVRDRGHHIDMCICEVAVVPKDPAAPSAHRMSCNKTRRTCDIYRVVGNNADQMRAASKAVEGRKPRVPAIAEEAIREARLRSHKSLGESLCWPLGDTIIAIEALSVDANLFSRDGDLLLIGPAIGLQMIDVGRA